MEIDIIEENIKTLDLKLLNLLLFDNSTKRNIVWATTDYNELGEYYAPECEITVDQKDNKHDMYIFINNLLSEYNNLSVQWLNIKGVILWNA